MSRLERVFVAIDVANAADPAMDERTGEPAALLYGRRMTNRLAHFLPDAGEDLSIAVRGQHIERFAIPRATFPMDRVGYLRWRNELKDLHARRLREIMDAAGYDEAQIERVGQIVRKERFKVDPQAQALEDVACLVFLEYYAPEFAAKHDVAKVIDIVAKTWKKMSAAGQQAALNLSVAPQVRAVVEAALAEPTKD